MKKNVLYIVIIVLVIAICFMGGILVGQTNIFKGNTKDNSITENEEQGQDNEGVQDTEQGDEKVQEQNKEVVTSLSIDSSIVQELASKVIGVYTNSMMTKYADYFYKKNKITLANEDISFKLSLAAESVAESFITNTSGYNCNNGVCGISYIDETTLKNAYYKLFGDSSDYSRAAFDVDSCAGEYSWSSSNNRYEATISDGCGGATFGGTMSKLGYAKQVISTNSDRIELYEYFAVEVPATDNSQTVNYYSDYTQTKLITSVATYADMYSNDAFFTKFAERSGVYKYTFEKNNSGNYIFTTVEKVA